MRVEKIPLEKLRFTENRNYGGEGDIENLAEDMNHNGLINPVTVKPVWDKNDSSLILYYEIVAGRRRRRAAAFLGWKEMNSNILEGDEIDRAEEIAAAENINRLEMHPLDEATLFQKLLESGETIEALSKRFDRTVSAIWQRIQLLGLFEGIKELFREGKIDLCSAAMLKGLDEERQIAFYDKFSKNSSVSLWDVKTFISKARHDRLYGCVAGKDCANCDKRTRYSDKALFPELENENDLCLDHDCYIGKWQKLLSVNIKKAKAGNKNFADANIIACDGDNLARIFGRSITVDGTEYAVSKVVWGNRPDDKPGENTKPCFLIDIRKYDGEETLIFVPQHWKQPENNKDQKETQERKNPFVPIVKFIGMPKEDEKQALTALTGKADLKKEFWELNQKASDIERKVKHRVLERLIDMVVESPESEKDIDLFLDAFMDKGVGKSIIKKFTGSDKAASLRKLSFPKLFTALYATTLNAWRLPDFDKFSPKTKNEIADWAGVPVSRIREMYLEELKPLVPVPKPVEPKPPAKKTADKKQAKKPVAGKPARGKKK